MTKKGRKGIQIAKYSDRIMQQIDFHILLNFLKYQSSLLVAGG